MAGDGRPRTFEWARQAAEDEIRSKLGDYLPHIDYLPAAMRKQVADKAVGTADVRIVNAILNGLGSERNRTKLMSLLQRGNDTAGFLARHNIDVEKVVRTELARFKTECREKFGSK